MSRKSICLCDLCANSCKMPDGVLRCADYSNGNRLMLDLEKILPRNLTQKAKEELVQELAGKRFIPVELVGGFRSVPGRGMNVFAGEDTLPPPATVWASPPKPGQENTFTCCHCGHGFKFTPEGDGKQIFACPACRQSYMWEHWSDKGAWSVWPLP